MRRLDRPDGFLHEPLRVGAFGAIETFLLLSDHGEQRDCRDTEIDGFGEFLEQQIDTVARDAGHRWHRLGAIIAFQYENRVN